MRHYLLIVIFSMVNYMSSAQTLDKYADELYFGMLSITPDSSITDFLKRYFPAVFKTNDSTSGWTAYPPGIIDEPNNYTVIHSYVFSAHPHFKGHFKSGQLAITGKIYTDERWNGDLKDIRLWFEFDNETDARNSFNQLVDTFSSFNADKRITSQQGMDKAEFTDKSSDKYYSRIEVILATDYSLGKRYVMPTENELSIIHGAGYRMFINVGNDLH